MAKVIVGDPHVKKTNIEESQRLWEWILDVAETKGRSVLVLGDIFNDFGVCNVEVLSFWHQSVAKAQNRGVRVEILVGNHDMSPDGTYNFPSFLDALVLDKPSIWEDSLYLPFIRSSDEFVRIVNESVLPDTKYLFCHQEFNGCQFENGFYAPNGVDPALLPSDLKVISGHIHMRQEFGNIFYPGTPRALTRSDANEIKGIHIFDNGSFEFIPTPSSVSEPMVLIKVSNDQELADAQKTLKGLSPDRVYIDITGNKKFVSDCLKKNWTSAKVRTTIQNDVIQTEVTESSGIPVAFNSYFIDYVTTKDLGKKEVVALNAMFKDLLPGVVG